MGKYNGGLNMSKDMVKYSMQLAMLKQLLDKKLITEKEYTMIKNKLMNDYKVFSNFTEIS